MHFPTVEVDVAQERPASPGKEELAKQGIEFASKL